MAPLIEVLSQERRLASYDAARALIMIGMPALAPVCAVLRNSPDAEARCWAAYVLGEIGSPLGVRPLCYALKDPDEWVRLFAAEALAAAPHVTAIGPLIDAIVANDVLDFARTHNHAVVHSCRAALQTLGEDAVEPLLHVLKSPGWPESRVAARALRRIFDPRAIDPFIEAMGHSSPEVRREAAMALRRFRAPSALPALAAALENTEPVVRRHCAAAMYELGDLRGEALLLEALRTGPSARSRRELQIWLYSQHALDGLSELLLDPLIVLLDDPSPHVRRHAATVLGQSRNPRAVEALLGCLNDPEANVRQRAVEALGKIGDGRACGGVVSMLNDPERAIRDCAVVAAARLGQPSAFDPLVALVEDPDGDSMAQTEALKMVAAMDDERVPPLLLRMLHHPKRRLHAATAVAERGMREAFGPLLGMIPEFRAAIREGKSTPEAESMLTAIGATGNTAVAHLMNVTGLKQIVDALGKLGDPRAIEPLRELMDDPGWDARRPVIMALKQIRDAARASADNGASA